MHYINAAIWSQTQLSNHHFIKDTQLFWLTERVEFVKSNNKVRASLRVLRRGSWVKTYFYFKHLFFIMRLKVFLNPLKCFWRWQIPDSSIYSQQEPNRKFWPWTPEGLMFPVQSPKIRAEFFKLKQLQHGNKHKHSPVGSLWLFFLCLADERRK